MVLLAAVKMHLKVQKFGHLLLQSGVVIVTGQLVLVTVEINPRVLLLSPLRRMILRILIFLRGMRRRNF